MKPLEKALKNIDGYLLSVERDAMKGKYELKVGIPKKWVYEANEKVECEVIHSTKQGDIVKIFSTNDDIVIDDLIEFVNIIIDTNKQIAEMAEEHENALKEAVKKLEDLEVSFNEQIENMAKNSFKNMKKKQNSVGSTSDILTEKELKQLEEKDDLEEEVEKQLSK